MAQENVPAGVETLLQILVGNDWPEGNEGDLRAMAEGWSGLGTQLSGSITEAVTAAASTAAKRFRRADASGVQLLHRRTHRPAGLSDRARADGRSHG
jgi:hypothetical protein